MRHMWGSLGGRIRSKKSKVKGQKGKIQYDKNGRAGKRREGEIELWREADGIRGEED